MDGAVNVSLNLALTPQQIAEAWAGLGSDGQADFYAHLWLIGSDWLCMQACHVSEEVRERARRGDDSARNAYEKLHGHAWDYGPLGGELYTHKIESAAREAKRFIAGLAIKAAAA